MFQISKSLPLYTQYFKFSSSITSRILPRGNMSASKTLTQFRFSSIPYQNLPYQGLLALTAGSVLLLGENFQLDVSFDQMEQLCLDLGEKPLEKKEGETDETFQKRYAQFLFKKVLEVCEKQETWILNKLDRQVLNQIRDTNGNSLLIAAATEAPRAIPWLVKEKIALDTTDANGNSALDIAESGREATKKIFRSSSFHNQSIRTNLNTWALSPNFVGRVDTFQKITQRFRREKLCVLSGLPGMGKTQAAYQYAKRDQPKYSQVWVVDCKSEAEKHLSYREIAEELGLGFLLETSNEELIEKRVHERLEKNTSKPWLLILDNAIEKPKIPQKGGKILVTTNQPGVWSKNQLPIESLSPNEAYQLLEKITKETPSHEMEVLAQELGYFPLAITLAANCIKESSTVAEFLKDFDPVRIKLSKDKYHAHTIQTLWKKMLTTILNKESLALHWLKVCSFLDPAHIPASWIGEWLEEKGEPATKAIEIEQTLTSFAIFKKTEDQEYLMHPLLQKVVRSNSPSYNQEVVLSLIQKSVERFDEDNAETWNDGRQASFHLYWLIREKFLPPLLFDTHLPLFSAAGENALSLGNFNHANELLSLALDLARKERGETLHPNVAASLNNLGILWREKGDLTKALRYHEKALAMQKQLYGETAHPAVASSLHNLENLWREKGDLTKALVYSKKAFIMEKQLYGETSHLDVADSLYNLGNLWREKGDLTKALVYSEKALAMYKQLYGETAHPAVAASLCNLGKLWREKGDLTKALRNHKKALAMQKQLYGGLLTLL